MVGYHREIHHFSEEKTPKELTAPQHARFILPLTSLDKIIAALRGRYFSLWETYLENFISRLNVIPAFQSTPLHKQGQELRSGQTVIPLHEQHNLYLFFAS